MSVEYSKSKEAALERLRATNVANLRKLQELGIEVEFSFLQSLGWTKEDKSMHPQFPVANQFSRLFLNLDIPTWNQFTYSNGVLKMERRQTYRLYDPYDDTPAYKRTGKVIDSKEGISLEEIPFNKFSENDLIEAA